VRGAILGGLTKGAPSGRSSSAASLCAFAEAGYDIAWAVAELAKVLGGRSAYLPSIAAQTLALHHHYRHDRDAVEKLLRSRTPAVVEGAAMGSLQFYLRSRDVGVLRRIATDASVHVRSGVERALQWSQGKFDVALLIADLYGLNEGGGEPDYTTPAGSLLFQLQSKALGDVAQRRAARTE
jgi:hypothetical protein